MSRYDDILKGNYKAEGGAAKNNGGDKTPEETTASSEESGGEESGNDEDEAAFINDADADEVMDLDDGDGHDEM